MADFTKFWKKIYKLCQNGNFASVAPVKQGFVFSCGLIWNSTQNMAQFEFEVQCSWPLIHYISFFLLSLTPSL